MIGDQASHKKRVQKVMSVMWITVKKMHCKCKSSTSEVHVPKPRRSRNKLETGSNPTSTFNSPMSVRSSDLINPVTHHVRFTRGHNGSPALRILRFDRGVRDKRVPGSPLGRSLSETETQSHGDGFDGCTRGYCRKCGESLARQDVEAHHLSKHAVTEVLEGDSTRKIIEIIFKTGLKSPTNRGNRTRIDRILKVHNTETKLAHFEDYREMVKSKATRLQNQKKHPRCLADGNELLRFYGTTLACSLGQNKSSSLCTLQTCNVCCILRHGFSSYKELEKSVLGVFTTSTSETAYKSIVIGSDDERRNFRKALILCRVIAGRVHKTTAESSQELVGGTRPGFDSLAGNLGCNSSHIEELYVLNSSALLPCFVIVCKS